MVTAIINGHYDVAALLVQHGADPNLADAAGMAAVYALVDMHTQPLMINRPTRKPSGGVEDLDLLRQILARGGDPNAALKSPILARYHNIGDGQLGAGATPLMRAARSRDVAAMRLLLDARRGPAEATGKRRHGADVCRDACARRRLAAAPFRKRDARGDRPLPGSRRRGQRRERAWTDGSASRRSGRRVRSGRQTAGVEGSGSVDPRQAGPRATRSATLNSNHEGSRSRHEELLCTEKIFVIFVSS